MILKCGLLQPNDIICLLFFLFCSGDILAQRQGHTSSRLFPSGMRCRRFTLIQERLPPHYLRNHVDQNDALTRVHESIVCNFRVGSNTLGGNPDTKLICKSASLVRCKSIVLWHGDTQRRRQLELDLHRGHEWSQEKWSQEDRQDAVRDFRQRGVSLGRHRHEFPFSVGSKGQAGLDIFRLQIRKIGENFLLCHAGSKIFEYVIDGDPEASNTRFPPSFSRFHRDAFAISHGCQFTRVMLCGQ